MIDTEDDDIGLRPDTLEILQQFLAEKAAREKQESALYNGEVETDKQKPSFNAFEEDWQLSQFWYNDETKQTLATVCKKLASGTSKIALLSCPSLYESVRSNVEADTTVTLFEFDRRFSCYGQDFVFYDYNCISTDSDYMHEFEAQFDIVLLDPPFLSEECISKLGLIVSKISKPTSKIVLCSGEVVETWANKYLELKKCLYQPQHQRNLGNVFASYSNFDLDALITR